MHFILSKMKKYTERQLTLLTKKKKKSSKLLILLPTRGHYYVVQSSSTVRGAIFPLVLLCI